MMKSDRSVRGYNRLASFYRWLELPLFGRDLQRARVGLLDDLPSCQHVLLLGDGDGRFLRAFCASQPECEVTSIEQSPAMLRLQAQRICDVNELQSVKFLCQDAREEIPSANYDLIVMIFFLDCFDVHQVAACLPRWLDAVRPGGLLYFVDFVEPRSGWQRLRAKVYLALMHWLFRWQTGLTNRRLVNLDAILERQSMVLLASKTSNHGMIVSRLYRV